MSTLLTRLSRLNPTTVFLGVLVLVLLGLFVPGVVGGLLLLILALVLGALVVGTWQRPPAVSDGARAKGPDAIRPLRLGVLLLLLVVALIKII